jgi:hypothetical protein
MSKNHQLRAQINTSLTEPIATFEKSIADTLNVGEDFSVEIDSEMLGHVLRKVIYNVVSEQKLANVEVPTVHNISQMDARIGGGEAKVECEIHIHQPIVAFIRLRYTLENDPRSCGKSTKTPAHWTWRPNSRCG